MKYILSIFAVGKFPQHEISEEAYERVKTAHSNLTSAFSISEKYEILLQNYLELEKELLSISAESMIKRPHEYDKFFEMRLSINRRIVNLLTSTKLFYDQVPRNVRTILNNSTSIKQVKSLFSVEYDSSFEYRFMEALRNHIQHNGLSVHSTSHPFTWVGDNEDKQLEFKTEAYSSKQYLAEDKSFKRSVLNEMPEKVELIHAVRKYIVSISKVHVKIQDKIKDKVDSSRKEIKENIERYGQLSNGQITGLSVYAVNTDGLMEEEIERIPVLTDWDDVRISLQRKHKPIGNLDKRFVSSR